VGLDCGCEIGPRNQIWAIDRCGATHFNEPSDVVTAENTLRGVTKYAKQ
jgi:hypothetical protein